MDIIVIATNPAIKTIDLRTAGFVDDEDDKIRLSNSTPKLMPISFWPDPSGLTFEGKPFESLGLSAFTLALLLVSGKNITVDKLLFNPERVQDKITKLTAEIDKVKAKGATQPKGLWKGQQEKVDALEEEIATLESLLANPVTSLTPIPLVPAGQMNEAMFWGLTVPYVKGETKFDVLGERKIQAEDSLKLNSL